MADKIVKRGISIFLDGKEVANSVKGIRTEMQKLSNEQAKMTVGSDNYIAHGKKIAYLDSLLQEHRGNMKKIATEYGNMSNASEKYTKETEGRLSRLANGFNKYWGVFTAGLASITGLTLGLKKFMDMRMEMEDASANLQSLTGLGDKDIAWLRNYAKELSTTTTEAGVRITTSSKEIMDGFTTIGSKRPELLKNKEAMADLTKQALTLAATGVPTEEAFNVVTASLNQFNLEAKDGSRVINAIAAGSLAGSAEANNLGESLKNVGTVANDSNMTLEDTVAMLEVLASKQLLSEEAGTKMRGALLKLKEAGVGYQSGVFNLKDALVELNGQLEKKTSAAEKDALKTKVFGAENVTVGTIMLQNVDAYDKMRVAVTGTNTAYDQAVIRTKTVSATLAQAKNKFSEMGMELVKNLSPAMLKAANFGNGFMKVLVEFPKIWKENKVGIIAFTAALGAYIIALNASNIALKAKVAWSALDRAADYLKIASMRIRIAVTGQATIAELRLIAAQKAMNSSMMLNIYTAAAVAIAAIGYAVYKMATQTTAAGKAWKEFNKEAESQVYSANQLFEALKKTTEGSKERKILIDKINSVYGELLDNQLTEKSNLDQIDIAQRKVNTGLREKIALETKERAKADIIKEQTDKQIDAFEALRDRVVKIKGEDMGNVIMENIKSIIDNNSGDLIKAHKLASEYLSGEAGKDLKYGDYEKLRTYTNSLIRMNRLLADVEKRFNGFTGSDPLTIYKPNDHKKGGGAADADAAKSTKTIAGLKQEIQDLTQKWEDAEIGSKNYFKLQQEIARKQAALDKLINKTPKNKDLEKPVNDALLKEQNGLKKLYSENEITKEVYDERMLDLEVKYLEKKRDLYKKGSSEYNKYQSQLYDISIKKNMDANQAHLASIEASYKSINDATVAFEQSEKDRLQSELDDKLITQEEYDNQVLDVELLMSQARLNNAIAYAEMIRDATFNSEADKDAAVKAANDAVEASNAVYLKLKGKKQRNGNEDDAKRYADLERLRQQLGLDQEKLGYLNSLTALKAYLKEKKATIEETEEFISAYRKQKAVEYAQQAVSIANGLSDFIQTSHQAEADSLEAAKQRELTAAGNNADAREKIEKKYAQKELDLKKKQADANMGIAIAQALANGALGVAEIWAKTGINPVYAGILTALLAGITGAQISAAVEQRNAIKSASLGYYDGGFHNPEGWTGGSDPRQVRGYFPDGQPYHGQEFIANHRATRNPNLRPLFNMMDAAQRNGTIGSLGREDISRALRMSPGYSDGGWHSSSAPSSSSPVMLDVSRSSDADLIRAINRLNDRLDDGITAESVISGRTGSYEQTKKYEKLIKNASR